MEFFISQIGKLTFTCDISLIAHFILTKATIICWIQLSFKHIIFALIQLDALINVFLNFGNQILEFFIALKLFGVEDLIRLKGLTWNAIHLY